MTDTSKVILNLKTYLEICMKSQLNNASLLYAIKHAFKL